MADPAPLSFKTLGGGGGWGGLHTRTGPGRPPVPVTLNMVDTLNTFLAYAVLPTLAVCGQNNK